MTVIALLVCFYFWRQYFNFACIKILGFGLIFSLWLKGWGETLRNHLIVNYLYSRIGTAIFLGMNGWIGGMGGNQMIREGRGREKRKGKDENR